MKEGREINYTIRLGLKSKRRAEPEQADEEDGEEGTKTEDFDTYEKTEDFDTFETEKNPLKEEREEDKEQTMSSRSDSEIAKGPPKENKIEIDAQEMEKNPPKEEKKPLKKQYDNRSDSEIAIDPPKEYSKDLKNLRSLWKELKKEIGTVEATWSSFKKKIDKIIVSRIYHHWKQGDTVDTGNKEQRTKGGQGKKGAQGTKGVQGTKGAHGTKGANKKLSHHIDQI